MAGTIEGGKRAAAENIKRHGKQFYSNIGKLGGAKSRNGGFGSDKVGKDGLTGKERASIAGKRGGAYSPLLHKR